LVEKEEEEVGREAGEEEEEERKEREKVNGEARSGTEISVEQLRGCSWVGRLGGSGMGFVGFEIDENLWMVVRKEIEGRWFVRGIGR
jgi:hypothetical protein